VRARAVECGRRHRSQETIIQPIHEFARQHGFDVIEPPHWAAHLPASVAAALPPDDVVVFSCLDEHSDTAAFSARYGLGLEDCANTLILKYTTSQGEHFAAVVTLGSRRLDINGAVKDKLGARRLSLARREVATQITGMAFGGITAFGLPDGMPVLVDAAVLERRWVVVGAGVRPVKILVAPSALMRLPLAEGAALTLALG
jgi:prolyl-tRNA editing enzyme YbaK/EbsC (Cys-tRNA(Pro) deacylase)